MNRYAGAAWDGRRKPRIPPVIVAIFACPPPCVERCRACRTLGMMAQSPDPSEVEWWVVVPVKGGGAAKTRLVSPPGTDKRALARALALDTVTAVSEAVGPRRVTVVTGSRSVTTALAPTRCVVVADPGTGLNDAVRAGVAQVPRAHTAAAGAAVLLGDLPAARAVDLRVALQAAARHQRAVVPDHHGDGCIAVKFVSPKRFKRSVAHAGRASRNS